MQTIKKPTHRTTRVELNGREIAILEACLFDGMVRLLKDSKSFDITDSNDDAFILEGKIEADIIRGIQRKMEFAQKMMDSEQ